METSSMQRVRAGYGSRACTRRRARPGGGQAAAARQRQRGSGSAAARQRGSAAAVLQRQLSAHAPPNPSSLFQVPLLEESGSTPMLAHIAWNWALLRGGVGGVG